MLEEGGKNARGRMTSTDSQDSQFTPVVKSACNMCCHSSWAISPKSFEGSSDGAEIESASRILGNSGSTYMHPFEFLCEFTAAMYISVKRLEEMIYRI